MNIKIFDCTNCSNYDKCELQNKDNIDNIVLDLVNLAKKYPDLNLILNLRCPQEIMKASYTPYFGSCGCNNYNNYNSYNTTSMIGTLNF